jgi:hypothetical protein
MAAGGIHDYLGCGFHRYATDSRWRLPHFEKMLYDQAGLAMAFTEAFQVGANPGHARVLRELLESVRRDFLAPEGGFYSALDADSEGEEGKFYLWTESEIRSILSPVESEIAIRSFRIEPEGNYLDEASGQRTGRNVLHMGSPPWEIEEDLEPIRRKLFRAREKRIRPGRDEKVLCDWNGLMIAALSKAARALNEPRYARTAESAAEFILERMTTGSARLFHRYAGGEAQVPGFLNDYAFLVFGLIELYQATFEVRFLKRAISLNRVLLERFWDPEGFGFFLAPDDGEGLIFRGKEFYDGAIPSGNSVMTGNLLRLSRLTGDVELEKRAGELARAFTSRLEAAPTGYTGFLSALDLATGPGHEVVVVGERGSKDTERMLEALGRHYSPNLTVIFRPLGGSAELDRLARFTRDLTAPGGRANAYVCRDFHCEMPTTSVSKMLHILSLKDTKGWETES